MGDRHHLDALREAGEAEEDRAATRALAARLQRLPQRVGPAAALDLMLTGLRAAIGAEVTRTLGAAQGNAVVQAAGTGHERIVSLLRRAGVAEPVALTLPHDAEDV